MASVGAAASHILQRLFSNASAKVPCRIQQQQCRIGGAALHAHRQALGFVSSAANSEQKLALHVSSNALACSSDAHPSKVHLSNAARYQQSRGLRSQQLARQLATNGAAGRAQHAHMCSSSLGIAAPSPSQLDGIMKLEEVRELDSDAILAVWRKCAAPLRASGAPCAGIRSQVSDQPAS